MTGEVALGHVGIVLGLEVSRLARNNADWYRLLELCGITDTLIGDNDGIYHPELFNDRLAARAQGHDVAKPNCTSCAPGWMAAFATRRRAVNCAGDYRSDLIWGEEDGEVLFHPDQAVTGAIRTVFERFTEIGSARRVWLWFRSTEPDPFRCKTGTHGDDPLGDTNLHDAFHQILTNPVYAGAYTYGKTRQERYVDEHGGRVRKRMRHLPRSQWAVRYSRPSPRLYRLGDLRGNQARLAHNTHPRRASVWRRGEGRRGLAARYRQLRPLRARRLRVYYRGRNSTPGYHCAGKRDSQWAVESSACNVGGLADRPSCGRGFPRGDHAGRGGGGTARLPNNWNPIMIRRARAVRARSRTGAL